MRGKNRNLPFLLATAALMLLSCNVSIVSIADPSEEEDELYVPNHPETESYEFKTIEYDGLLAGDSDDSVADKSDSDIYWEAEAEADGTFNNTIRVIFDGNTASVQFNAKAEEVFSAEVQGADVAIFPKGWEVKKCEIIAEGTSDNGSLKIYCTTDPADKDAGKKVKLTLKGLELRSQRGPAINYQAGKRLFLHLADGTDNSLEDCAQYKDDIYYFPGRTSADEDRKGCLFSEKALVVSGKGRLTVKGNYNHAICVDNQFHMRPGPTVVVTGASKNCLHCNDEIRFAGGYFYAFNASAGGKGIKTDANVAIDGGRLVVNTSGAYGRDENGEQDSPKGIKADGDIEIGGGFVTVRSIGSCDGSEGIESKTALTIDGGTVNSIAYDDAINASLSVTVNGGRVFCLSTHNDGIDSNGDIHITGGSVTAMAANMETSLDNDNPGSSNTFTIDGGDVIGIGGTAYAPSSSSAQYSVLCYGCQISTSSEVSLTDAEGNTLLSTVYPLNSQSVALVLSSPSLTSGGTYSISVNGVETATFTVSGKVTTVGSQSWPGAGGGGFGGGGGHGRN